MRHMTNMSKPMISSNFFTSLLRSGKRTEISLNVSTRKAIIKIFKIIVSAVLFYLNFLVCDENHRRS